MVADHQCLPSTIADCHCIDGGLDQDGSTPHAEEAPSLDAGHVVFDSPQRSLPIRGTTVDKSVDAVALPVSSSNPSSRFLLAPRAPENETALRPALDLVFGRLPYDVECRARVCRVQQKDDGSTRQTAWADDIQTSQATAGMFRMLEVTGQRELIVYVDLADPSDASSNRVMEYVVTTFFESEEYADCNRSRTSYTEKLVLNVALDNRRKIVVINKSQSTSPLAQCMVDALEEACKTVPVPPDLKVLPPWPIDVGGSH